MPPKGASAQKNGPARDNQLVTWADRERHLFLQTLMQRGYLSQTEASAIVRRIVRGAQDSDFDRFMADCDTTVLPLNYSIRKQRLPNAPTGEYYVAMINRKADDPTKLATRFKPEQLGFFKHIIEHMAVAPNCSMLSREVENFGHRAADLMRAENPNAEVKSIPVSKVMELVNELCRDGWLATTTITCGVNQNAGYTLGPRTYLELGNELLSLDGVPDDTRKMWEQVM